MNSIFGLLLNLGMHIGSYSHLTKTSNYIYLLGNRKNFSIIDIQSILYQIKRTLFFLKELGKINSFLLFYHSNIQHFPFYFKLFLVHFLNIRYKQGFVDQPWSYGQLSNLFTQIRHLFYTLFYLDSDLKDNRKKIEYSFYNLFHRLLFFTLYKRLTGVSWLSNFNSVKKFWRFFFFFKYYSFCKDFPDSFIYLNGNNSQIPIVEAETMHIPSILVSNTSISSVGSSYFILSNVSSLIITLFYFILFMNSYNYGLLGHFIKK
uniref:Ribosomal protein S2 n=1 Tax=Stachyamoeba lipophora TaxID=463046 RepID=A0A0B5GNQ2_STALP|nr:ribosomal protein S2 [Stachyamoeba lipophora]AJF22909.1 ribosomal protein S2 [Stachyamoeba lipophora]